MSGMKPYPEGCEGCNGSCCWPARGEPPFGNPATGKEGRCSEVLDNGRCGIEVREGYAAKPAMCKAAVVGGDECTVMRERKWRL